MTPQDRMVIAANDFCREELALRAQRKSVSKKSCNVWDHGEPEIGDFGVPPCEDYATACDNCKLRMDGLLPYRGSIRRRYAAKRRMLRAYLAVNK